MKEVLLLCIAYILVSSSFSQYEQFPPSFTDPPTSHNVEEGNYTDNPKFLFNLNATVRSPKLNVTISVEGPSSDIVYVNFTQNTSKAYGQVYVKAQLDRERGSQKELIFTARSSKSTVPPSTHSIILIIDDINDESPVFNPPAYQVTLPENFSVNTRVQDLKIYASDPDVGLAGLVNYNIEPTGQAKELYRGYFTIDTSEYEGAYLILSKELDYETLTFLQYKIIATDGEDPFHNSTAELLVKVQDVQDKPPTFQRLPYIKNVPENVKGAIFTVTALDGDLGIPRHVNYGLINDSCASYLSINKTSGEIRVKETLDRDKGTIYEVRGVCSIKVEAFEVGTNKTNETQSTTDFTLTIDDINDNPPTFSNQTYEGSVAESATGITITFSQNIHVEDIDQNGHNAISLTVLYSNLTVHDRVKASPAEIIGNGIVLLRVIKPFDFEEEESVDLVLMANDTGNQSLYNTCIITVKINDTNDNDPVFNETYDVYVHENSCQNTSVGHIQATDEDSGDFGNISYRINGVNNGFGIDSESGRIYVASNESCNCLNISCEESILDREKIQEYYMTMEAQDGGGRRTPVSVVIHLLDENDNAPIFRDLSYEFSIKENSSVFSSGKNIAVLTASDEDKKDTNNSRVSYCILDEDDNCTSDKHFTIDNNGTITIIKELDFENLTASSSSEYYRELILKVMAYDHGNKTLNSTVNVTIIVQDENDNGPKFNGSYVGHVKENSPPGTSILRVSADDDDGTAPNNEVSYFIFLGGSDQFKMDGNSGNLSVQIGAKLDRESVSSYNLTIIAIDKGNPQRTGTTNVTLEIDDVNDTPPELLNLPNKIQVEENKTDNKIIFICNGSDKDIDSVLSYSIQIEKAYDHHGQEFNVSKDYFTINKTTGEKHVRDFVDAEKESSFLLNIAVTDEKTHENANTTKAVLTVNIIDINDNPPVFTDKSLSAGLLRSSPYNTVVMDLKDFVSDQDSTAKHRIHKFYLSSITKHGLDEIPNDIITSCKKAFCVTENGTVVSNILFTGKGRMELNIEVNDTAGSSQATLDIYIIDESQQLSMHFQRSKNDVNKVKEDVLSTLSDKIGYKCVFDQINPYQDKDDNIFEYQSLLTFHVIDEKKKIVLDAIFVEGVLDKHGDDLKELRNRHGVAAIGALQITDVGDEGSKIKETYILVAAIVLLTLILGIVIYFYISTSSKFKRRLKAATISSTEKKNSQSLGNAVIPGSNMFSKNKNPLIDKDEEVQRTIGDQDCASLAGSEDSLDCNEVEYEKRDSYLGKDPVEEKEAVLEMYGEDGGFPIINHDDMALLKQALQQHDKFTSENENGGSKDGGLDVIQGKVNEGYEIVEATDV